MSTAPHLPPPAPLSDLARRGGSPPSHPSYLPSDEPILLSFRPGFAFVFLYRQGWWLIPPLLIWGVHWALLRVSETDPVPWLLSAAWAWLILGFVWRIVAWLCRRYVLTDRRALVIAGVLSRVAGDVPLTNIQNTSSTQTIIERALGLGTIGIATAAGPAINWLMVPRPRSILDSLRHAADHAKRRAATDPPPPLPLTSSPPHLVTSPGQPSAAGSPTGPPVIGLSGGIGAGKTEVARILASLGAVVIDSDREAKEALDRPEVRTQLLRWWGQGILTPDGRINRHAVADIIFADPEQRRRLESVVHPIVRTRRAAARQLAAERGARAVVIDAPLLFEAGVDRECDTIIFVDAPRPVRLERVRQSRGWNEAELTRREAQQIPLEEKRRRSQYVIVNDVPSGPGASEGLRAAVEAVFVQIIRGR